MLESSAENGLAVVQAHYAARINAAVAAGRMELVRDLTNDYVDEALELMLTVERSSPGQPVEILEFGFRSQHAHRVGTRRLRFWPHRNRLSAQHPCSSSRHLPGVGI